MNRKRVILAYTALVGLPTAILLTVLGVWRPGTPADNAAPAALTHAAGPQSNLFLLVLEIVVILVAAKAVGAYFRSSGSPGSSEKW